MPDIHLTDLRKAFPDGTVGIHPTSFVVPDGSHFVLLGPSGSGKTTLLRLVAGLETPDGGTIHFGDRQVQHLSPHERRVAFMTQRAALYPDRDVRGNIRAGLEFEQKRLPRARRLAPAEIDRRVGEAAELLGISALLDRQPHEISGGEARRVVLARALVRTADLYLFDEPLGHLDSPLAAKLSQDLHLLQRQLRLTILHVTHDPNEAMALADRVGLLGGGRVLQTGQPGEVYARPGSRTVGLHFGRPPINLIDGTGDGSTCVSADGWLRVACPHVGALTLGIRPADVGFTPGPGFARIGSGDAGDPRRVDDRFLVPIRGAKTELWALVDQPPKAGTLDVWVKMDRLHWFDQASGDRVGG
jgi:multiple sugar transport system ATP-binding protein